MAYDEESLFVGISIGKSMKGWSRAPAKSATYKGGTIPLNYAIPYSANILPCIVTTSASMGIVATINTCKKTINADYLEVT